MSRIFITVILQLLIGLFSYVHSHPKIVIKSDDLSRDIIDFTFSSVNAIAKLIEDQDGGEISRLRRRAHDAVITSLASHGYFSPKVHFDFNDGDLDERWDIFIEAGKIAVVSDLNLIFLGRINSVDYADRVCQLKNNWPLLIGKVFTNSEWAESKKKLLNAITSRDFLLAKIVNSEARIDTETAKVYLSVTIDSGPIVLMGDVYAHGFINTPFELVEKYSKYKKYIPFNQDLLNDWQQYLQSTKLFSGALITIDSNYHQEQQSKLNFGSESNINLKQLPYIYKEQSEITLPVHITVVESPLKQIAASVGVDDSAYGVRLEGTYRQNMIKKIPVILSTGIGIDKLHQKLFANLNLLPKTSGEKDSFGVMCSNSDFHGIKVTRFALGFTRVNHGYNSIYKDKEDVNYETSLESLLAYDHIDIRNDSSFSLPTLTNTFSISRNYVDNKYNPKQGNITTVSVGAGVSLNKLSPYARLRFRSQLWCPINKVSVITFRTELGKICSFDSNGVLIPDDFGFRVGGPRSIRGYSYQSIGSKRAFAVVGARMMSVFSIEYNYYFNDKFGASCFVDLGDAFNSFRQIRLNLGYGIGARFRTPAGPLALDLAYGKRSQDIRLHFSLGIAF